MEIRTIDNLVAGVQLEQRADDKPARIRGHAAIFYDGTTDTEFRLWDDAVERIMPPAFDQVLSRPDDVRGLFNHDPNQLLGRTSAGTLSLAIDRRGLSFSVDPGATTVARDVTEHVRRGDVQGASFSFIATDERWEKQDGIEVRELHGVQVFDVGPVTFPAYQATDVQARAIARASRDAWQAGGAGGAGFDPAYINRRNLARLRVLAIDADRSL